VRPIPSRLDRLWPGSTFVCRLDRIRELKDRCSRQIVYAITSLPEERADPKALLALARGHWAIENSLFHVRDVTFKEDARRVRTLDAPANLAALRDATLALIRQDGQKPRPAREAFAANPKRAIRRVIGA
jgi:Transposase DDE domain